MALAAILTPIWLTCLVLHIQLLAHDRLAWFPIYAAPAENVGSHPIFQSYWPDTPSSDRSLVPGDRLLAFQGIDLRGADRLRLLETAFSVAGEGHRFPARIQRGGQEMTVSVGLLPHSAPWRTIPLTVGLGLAAIFAFLRSRGRPAARGFALGALSYSFLWLLQLGGPPWQTRLGLFLMFAAGSVVLPFTLGAALKIPDDLSRRAEGSKGWVWLFALPGPLNLGWILGAPIPGETSVRLLVAVYAVFIAALFGVLAHNYRNADARGRRQLKWVALGFYLGLTPALAFAVATAYDPSLRWLYEWSLLATPIIPVCILIAILRDSFLDIDRILTTTLTYTLFTPLLLGGVLTVGSFLATELSQSTGIEYQTALWFSGIVMATTVRPFSRQITPMIERLVAAEQIHLRRGLRALTAELEGLSGPGPLLRDAGKRLVELLQLETCVIYARAGEVFTPILATGSLVPSAIAVGGSLARLVSAADVPVSGAQWRSWARRRALDRQEGAALETLDAALIIPLRRDHELFGFLCLGNRETGDAFSATDTVLLEALGGRISMELDRYDMDVLESQERSLRARLKDYVPEPVAEEIERGGNVELGEIEISILFVDMRGYSTISSGLGDKDVFSLTNAYTGAVSDVIRARGGVVVEFQGDGLMAVFGAPSPLEDKESHSVAAAIEAFEVISSERFSEWGHGNLSVGVGIATGTAFVGTIQSAGQKVWSAMGNNVNLAARLEGLTKTLDASVVIDETTFRRLGSIQHEFRLEEAVSIKGRDRPIDVYVRSALA